MKLPPTEPPTAVLIQQAGVALTQGRFDEAERLWREVHRREPEHPQALYALGAHALQRGRAREASEYLLAAHQIAPRDPTVLLLLANALKELGQNDDELRALDAALALDPYFLPALLSKAAWYERHGRVRVAAEIYRNCLKIAPPAERWSDALRGPLSHARQRVAEHSAALAAHLRDALGAVPSRWQEAIDIAAGLSRPYPQDCNQLCVPRLPAIPFYERERFPWIDALEGRTEAIRQELEAALAETRADFTPYVAYRPGDPVNQWAELNHSPRWSAYHLYRAGTPVTEHLARCPITAAALAEADVARIEGLCPNAMFSALEPGTHIPPHHGETNARLVVHLPLIVPPGCSIRVGYETRQWQTGECLIFDDTIEHEARNDGAALRVVLIFDTWNPLLSAEERVWVATLAAARKRYLDDPPAIPPR